MVRLPTCPTISVSSGISAQYVSTTLGSSAGKLAICKGRYEAQEDSRNIIGIYLVYNIFLVCSGVPCLRVPSSVPLLLCFRNLGAKETNAGVFLCTFCGTEIWTSKRAQNNGRISQNRNQTESDCSSCMNRATIPLPSNSLCTTIRVLSP